MSSAGEGPWGTDAGDESPAQLTGAADGSGSVTGGMGSASGAAETGMGGLTSEGNGGSQGTSDSSAGSGSDETAAVTSGLSDGSATASTSYAGSQSGTDGGTATGSLSGGSISSGLGTGATSAGGCTPADECMVDGDCLGSSCIDCMCVATTTGVVDTCVPGTCATCSTTDLCGNCVISPGGECSTEAFACAANSACVSMAQCYNGCASGPNFDACVATCAFSYPAGVSAFQAVATCVGTECP